MQEYIENKVDLRKLTSENDSSINAAATDIMTTFATRLAILSLTAFLAACGSGAQIDGIDQTAGLIISNAAMPAPDCAADGCKGLRIIDANAEAYRYAAQQRG